MNYKVHLLSTEQIIMHQNMIPVEFYHYATWGEWMIIIKEIQESLTSCSIQHN